MKVKVVAVLLFIGLVSSALQAQAACVPSPLSPAEARRLLSMVPAADAAKRLGGRIEAMNWSPGSDFRNDVYYFYTVLTDKKQVTILENGLIGYFAVNKTTGEVVEATLDARVESKALEAIQRKIRAQHCISPEMVRKGESIPVGK